MNVRKLLKHRARLSGTKRWFYFRKDGKLVCWCQSPNYRMR